jgi:hypothetical protein
LREAKENILNPFSNFEFIDKSKEMNNSLLDFVVVGLGYFAVGLGNFVAGLDYFAAGLVDSLGGARRFASGDCKKKLIY